MRHLGPRADDELDISHDNFELDEAPKWLPDVILTVTVLMDEKQYTQ